MDIAYDAVLVLSFGGPERHEDVIPFLENVTRGRGVPRERLLEVAEHYYHFDGRSPINDQNRKLIAEVGPRLQERGPALPVYWGNRNWHPLLEDTLRQMSADGIKRAVAFVTSAFSSFSSCRQYLQDIDRARAAVGPSAPMIDKIRPFFNHPLFIECVAAETRAAINKLGDDAREVPLVFTAHSIPNTMADSCAYVEQLQDACRLVSEAVGHSSWRLVYQSRSGSPSQPWLGPDILEHIQSLADARESSVIVVPIGFTSDHMEVLYDLDTEAKALCDRFGIRMVRAGAAGKDPRFVELVRDLIVERIEKRSPKAVGRFAALPDQCAADCCPQPQRPATVNILKS